MALVAPVLEIQAAFSDVANKRRSLHGQWIPVKYWAFLVSKELGNCKVVVAAKLKKNTGRSPE
jgi:hypothetical protein